VARIGPANGTSATAFSERVGDDSRLDSAGQRSAAARVVAHSSQPASRTAVGEALASFAVIEIGHGSRSELACEPVRRAPQLGLFGGVTGIHK
jgi:hypothetical protein